jgi:hypothetical protein
LKAGILHLADKEIGGECPRLLAGKFMADEFQEGDRVCGDVDFAVEAVNRNCLSSNPFPAQFEDLNIALGHDILDASDAFDTEFECEFREVRVLNKAGQQCILRLMDHGFDGELCNWGLIALVRKILNEMDDFVKTKRINQTKNHS